MRRPMPIAIALGLLGTLSTTPAHAVWSPAPADGDPPRVHLVTTSSGASLPQSFPVAQLPTFYRIERGDSLTVPVVAGATAARVEIRPVAPPGQNPVRVTYTLQADSLDARTFRHRGTVYAVVEARSWDDPEDPGPRHLIGVEKRTTHTLPQGAGTLRLWLEEDDASAAFVRVLQDVPIEEPVREFQSSFRPRQDLRIDVGLALVGYRSNAYRAPKGLGPEVGSGFWPGKLRVRYGALPTETLRLRASYTFEGRIFEDADLTEMDHALRLEQRLRPGDSRRFNLKLDQRLRRHDETFTSRGATDEFETSVADSTISLADRFDYDDIRLRATASYALLRPVVLSAQGTYLMKNYHEDYTGFADIDALDYQRWDIELNLRLRLSRAWNLNATVGDGRKTYREKFARDLNGDVVVDIPTRYQIRFATLELRRAPFRGFLLGVAGTLEQTIDDYVGYWNRTKTEADAWIGLKWGSGRRVELYGEYTDTPYDNARLYFDPLGPLKEKSRITVGLGIDYRLWPGVAIEANVERLDQDNNNPTFAYEETEVTGGLRLTF